MAQAIRNHRPFAVYALLLAGGCFDPAMPMEPVGEASGKAEDPGEEDDAGDDECLPTGDVCASAVECCGYEGTSEVGDALCSGFGSDYRCTNVCRTDDDCVEGCCIALAGISDYGSCDSCAGVPFGSDTMVCLAGVELLCSCVEGTDAACTDAEQAQFEASCGAIDSPDAQLLICMANAGSCTAAAEQCIPDE